MVTESAARHNIRDAPLLSSLAQYKGRLMLKPEQECCTCTSPSRISCPYQPRQHGRKGLWKIDDSYSMTPHMFPSCLQKCFTCTNPSGISCPYKPQQHCQKGLRNIYDGCSMMSLMILLGSLLWLLLSSFIWYSPFVNVLKIRTQGIWKEPLGICILERSRDG